MRYKIVRYYRRSHEQVFATELEARRALEAHALTSKAASYAELWAMETEEDGEQIAVFDYGCTKPEELVRK